jgi:hypothetical protein
MFVMSSIENDLEKEEEVVNTDVIEYVSNC